MVIKYWAKVVGIGGSGLNFTTYALVMLVIFYLQQLSPPLLPPITRLQRAAHPQEFVSGWLVSFSTEDWEITSEYPSVNNNMSLKELLAGFFQFYRDFDYQNVICPLLGRPVPVHQFQNVEDIPEEMALYKEKLESKPSDPKLKFKTDTILRAQDPLELHWNITKNVSADTFFAFIAACKMSCKLIAEQDEKSLLSSLLSINKNLLHSSATHFKKVVLRFPEVKPDDSVSDTELLEHYNLITEAVLAVMRHVVKADVVELNTPSVMNKVLKGETAVDVHSASNSDKEDDSLAYNCKGYWNIIEGRKQMSVNLNYLKLRSYFEKEVCVSNALLRLKRTQGFHININISSFERSKLLNAVEIVVPEPTKKKKKQQQKDFPNEVAEFIFVKLNSLVEHVMKFIIETKRNSPTSDPKQSLKELLDLKLAELPTVEPQSKESESKVDSDQAVIKRQTLLLTSIEKNIPEEDNLSIVESSSCDNLGEERKHPDTCNLKRCHDGSRLEGNTSAHASSIRDLPTISIDCQAEKNNCLTKRNLLTTKSERTIDEFLNPNKTDKMVSSLPVISGKDKLDDKFANLLGSILKCETQSSFTAENSPLTASIDKISSSEFTKKSGSSENKTKPENNSESVLSTSETDHKDKAEEKS